MKSNRKIKIIILLILGILFAFIPILTNNPSLTTSEFKHNNLKVSAISGKIHIDGNSGWLAFKNDGNCTGQGIFSDPYVIQGLEIDGGNSGSCILINNSDVYFIIENCTVFKSGYRDAGIQLHNVTKGKLVINNCTSNYYGIFLEDCDNNTILDNIVNDNYRMGICLEDCDNNTILDNIVNDNYGMGIFLEDCDNNTLSGNTANTNSVGIYLYHYSDNNIISGNTANNNLYDGVRLYQSENNTITGNIASNNGDGIILKDSNNNKISGNTANNNDRNGIFLEDSKNTTILGNIMNECGLYFWDSFEEQNIDTTNLVNGKPLYYYSNEVNLGATNFTNAGQVILVFCNDSLVSNLDVSNGSVGIALYNCNNSTISGNVANHNNIRGIDLQYGNNNTISGNLVNFNFEDELWEIDTEYGGICVWYSDRIKISRNTVENNRNTFHKKINGILLWDCGSSLVSGNNISNNDNGITIAGGNNNEISSNNINENRDDGIKLELSSNNDITGNTINNNEDNGIFLSMSSNYNKILGNTLYNNDYGVHLYFSDNNTLYFNNFINNNENRFSYESSNIWNSPGKIIYTYNGVNCTNYLGNYWDDYTGNDANNDGVGDTPLSVGGVIDNYPLMEPIENYEIIEMFKPSEGSDGIIPGYNIFLLLCILSFIAIILSRKVKKS